MILYAAMIQQYRQSGFHIVRYQCYLVIIASCLTMIIFGLAETKSILLGGLTAILPTVYFAYTFFAKTGAQAAKEITRTFYRAEAVKLLSTGLLFVVIIKFFSPLFLPYFIGFVVAQMAFWVGPFFSRSHAVENK